MTASQRLFELTELPEPPAARDAGEPRVDAPPERQLTLVPGGRRRPEWWLSPRTRVVGKRGVADARAVLDGATRGRTADGHQVPTRRAG
jgi:hypothetical protein